MFKITLVSKSVKRVNAQKIASFFCRELIIQYWFFYDLASSRVKRLTDLNCKVVLVIIQDFLPPAHAIVVLLGCGKFCGRLGLLTWFTSFRINENFVEDTKASTMATREPSKGNFAKGRIFFSESAKWYHARWQPTWRTYDSLHLKVTKKIYCDTESLIIVLHVNLN